MLIGGNKEQVVANMRAAAERGDLNCKVEVDDPDLSKEERENILQYFLDNYKTFGYRFCNICARALTDTATRYLNRDTKIEGLDNLAGVHGGVIVTSNHFSPLDNTAVRRAMNKAGYRRLFMVSQETNLAMQGWIGFLMNHEDIIPLSSNTTYLRKHFGPMLHERLEQGHAVLIYPEQEMWFHYRKPRPPKRGPITMPPSTMFPWSPASWRFGTCRGKRTTSSTRPDILCASSRPSIPTRPKATGRTARK